MCDLVGFTTGGATMEDASSAHHRNSESCPILFGFAFNVELRHPILSPLDFFWPLKNPLGNVYITSKRLGRSKVFFGHQSF